MSKRDRPVLSVVVPVYNEAAGIEHFYTSLTAVLSRVALPYELLLIDDGSTDSSVTEIRKLCTHDDKVRLIKLTRNFGKEIALTAGVHAAIGDAVITLDADGQHPPELIPDFVAAWQQGAKVVIGVYTHYEREGLIKRYGTKLFYWMVNTMAGAKLSPTTTDYRLIDQVVQRDFNKITERNRITRGLIDWLGYQPVYIPFVIQERNAGSAGYSIPKLVKLAIDSVVSLSISPLYITAYIGAVVLPVSVLLGLGMVVNALLQDPLHLDATGGAYLMVFVLFLIGVLLVSQGIIGLYLSHIHAETQNRPLYLIDKDQSTEAP